MKRRETEQTDPKIEEDTANPVSTDSIEKPVKTHDRDTLIRIQVPSLDSPVIISIVFMAVAIASLAFSILANSQVLAFTGLGLILWSTLFLLVKPSTYVKENVLDASLLSTYTNFDRIIKNMKIKGPGYYIPPYPKEVYLPAHLKGLKETLVFISAEASNIFPSLEELARSRFIIRDPKGICIAPPGIGLTGLIEKELQLDLTKVDLDTLCETLPPKILENLQLASQMEMKHDNNQVNLRIQDSVYMDLYLKEKLESLAFTGCPLVSAIACEIAKVTGKTVMIQKMAASADANTVAVVYQIMER